MIGLGGMVLYYRFFHPAGPIKPFVGQSVDFNLDPDCKLSPDFVIHDARSASPGLVVHNFTNPKLQNLLFTKLSQ